MAIVTTHRLLLDGDARHVAILITRLRNQEAMLTGKSQSVIRRSTTETKILLRLRLDSAV